METHADVLLVTVTDVETRAVFDAFCGQQPPSCRRPVTMQDVQRLAARRILARQFAHLQPRASLAGKVDIAE